ncbi:MAG: hypothetical protein HKO53_15655, partial [Gemmatimonadetes bacterium]|nr:hypothetical protein [Gemmatimonadota bacterium]
VSGIQLELHFEGLRDGASSRQAFALALVQAVDEFLTAHLGPGWEMP